MTTPAPRRERPRDVSAASCLRPRWTHPVFAPGGARDRGDAQSVARDASRALPAAEALALVAGDDPRPLLVLRECRTCEGSDDALLDQRFDTERTLLLTRWFHLVKLPPHVLDASHPFHALFGDGHPAHLFVCDVDGSGRREFDGAQSPSDLWAAMEDVLALAYVDYDARVVPRLVNVLDRLDDLDAECARRETSRDRAYEEHGAEAPKARRAAREYEDALAERDALREAFEAEATLHPRP